MSQLVHAQLSLSRFVFWDEAINGPTIQALTTAMLHQMGIKVDFAIKLMTVVQQMAVSIHNYLKYLIVFLCMPDNVFVAVFEWSTKLTMPLSCYLCPWECGSVDEYTSHLKQRHALIEPCKLACNVDGCIQLRKLWILKCPPVYTFLIHSVSVIDWPFVVYWQVLIVKFKKCFNPMHIIIVTRLIFFKQFPV